MNSQQLADIAVLDTAGKPVQLGTLWQTRPTVLVFVRHFGCMLCRLQVAQLQRQHAAFVELGAEVVIVGPASASQAKDFVRDNQIQLPVYADAKGTAFAVAGLKKSVTASLSLRGLRTALEALRNGFGLMGAKGDPWRLGGVFVITPPNTVRWSHISQYAGDHPPVPELLRVLRELPANAVAS